MSSDLRAKHLHLDCFAGVAGDMFLGAAIDLGVPEAVIRDGLAALGMDGYQLVVGRKSHMSISGCDVQVVVDGQDEDGHGHGHGHDHDHDHHDHRHYADIRAMIEGSALADGAKARALSMFHRVAEAEARMHDVDVETVAFHEVGAVDSIVDIVGAAIVMDYLAPRSVSSRTVPLGHGTTRCAHGLMPVPAPASLSILAGCEVEDGGAAMELTTPTGATIVAELAPAFGELPRGRVVASGFGAGDRTLPDRPNHLRLVLLDRDAALGAADEVDVVEANVDDMTPELVAHVLARALEAGARDAWATPIVMKKGRPALSLGVMVDPARRDAIIALLFRESSTIGVRYRRASRRVLERRTRSVDTPFGAVLVKEAYAGDELVNVSPEHDSCAAAARASDAPLKDVYLAALRSHGLLASKQRRGEAG